VCLHDGTHNRQSKPDPLATGAPLMADCQGSVMNMLPVVQATCMIFAATYITLNLVADVLTILCDPRQLHPR